MFTFEAMVTANRRNSSGGVGGGGGGPSGGSGGGGTSPSGSTSLLSFRVNPLTGSVIVSRVTRVL